MNQRFLNANELCQILQISKSTLWRLREDGLPCLPVRGQLRFDREKVLAWLSSNQEESGREDPNHSEPGERLLSPGDYRCRGCGFLGTIDVPRLARHVYCPRCHAYDAERL